MQDRDEKPQPDPDVRNTVLEVFGMKLAVKNRQLAEILTRDAADIFGRDRGVPKADPAAIPTLAREVVAEALPHVLLAPPSAREGADDEVRAALRHRSDRVGERVGVQRALARQWLFDDGVTVHVRVISCVTSAAAAADVIRKLKTAVLSTGSGPQSVLLVTPDPQTTQSLRTAIDALGARCSFRVIDIGSLECLASLCVASSEPQALFASLISPQAYVAWPDLLAALRDVRGS